MLSSAYNIKLITHQIHGVLSYQSDYSVITYFGNSAQHFHSQCAVRTEASSVIDHLFPL